jgi:hypothetical protein
MASSERKRQEKLARKTAKRKQHNETLRRAEAQSGQGMSTAGEIALVSNHEALAETLEAMRDMPSHGDGLLDAHAPIHACLVPAALFGAGIGTVVVSRKLPDDKIAAAVFLLDVWCLGVKDAFVKVASASQYPTLLRHLSGDQRLKPIEPACARKLVEEAEAYAADLGFAPHPDYDVTRKIFGDIDKNTCRTQFRFGKDGKPFYVSGPRDTQAKSKKIVDTLMQSCGPGHFHYIVALDGAETVEDWMGVEEDAIEGELVAEEPSEEDRSPEEEREAQGGSSWLRRLPPFRR